MPGEQQVKIPQMKDRGLGCKWKRLLPRRQHLKIYLGLIFCCARRTVQGGSRKRDWHVQKRGIHPTHQLPLEVVERELFSVSFAVLQKLIFPSLLPQFQVNVYFQLQGT